jgi:hypothetical protein
MDTIVRISFASFKDVLIKNAIRGEKIAEVNRINGAKGGNKRVLNLSSSESKRIQANPSESKRIQAIRLKDEKTESPEKQKHNLVFATERTENVLETVSQFTTEIQPEATKKQKKGKHPFNQSEIWFLELFNDLKSKYRDNPRPHKSISETGRRNLQKLLDAGHLQPDFEHAITAMLGADWAKRTGNDTPDHLLREENFLRYLNVQSLKQVQYGSHKPNSEEQWSTAFDTLKEYYTTGQQPTGN